jgi:hypothetical protein
VTGGSLRRRLWLPFIPALCPPCRRHASGMTGRGKGGGTSRL